MFSETLGKLVNAALNKVKLFESSKAKYFVASICAGVYVGLGMLFVVVVGSLSEDPTGVGAHRILMGAVFGVALSLVVMTDSELFTGNNLVMTAGGLAKKVSAKNVFAIWGLCYVGNFVGSILIGTMFAKSGIADTVTGDFLVRLTTAKTMLDPATMFVKAILCNMLVCLATLCVIKMKEEIARLVMIIWCVFAFLTSGYEHSVANMAMFTASILMPDTTITVQGAFYNLTIVTLGNMVGGCLLGAVYTFLGKEDK